MEQFKKLGLIDKVILIVVLLFPLFLIKNSAAIKTLEDILFVFVGIKIIYSREYYISSVLKKVLISLLMMYIFIKLQFTTINNDATSVLNYMIYYFGLFIALTQINIKKSTLNLINKIFYLSSFIFIIYSWIYFYRVKFIFTSRFSAGFDIFIFGYIVSFFMLFHLIEYLKSEKFNILNIINLIIIILYIPLLLANGSRMNWISLFVLSIFIIIMNFDIKKIILVILVLTSIFVFSPNKGKIVSIIQTKVESMTSKTNSSNNIRWLMFKNAIDLSKENLILGNGFRNFRNSSVKFHSTEKYRKEYKEYFDYENDRIKKWPNDLILRDKMYAYFYYNHPHNNFLDILQGTGIFGALSYVLIFLFILIELIKRWIYNNKDKWLEFSIILILFLQMVGLTDTTIHMRRINEIVLFFAGISLSSLFSVDRDYKVKKYLKYKIFSELNNTELYKEILDKKINIFKEFKITKRNYVVGIDYKGSKYILKSPRNECRIPQRKIFTLLKKGESLSTLENINNLIEKYDFREFARPIMAIVKRDKGMIINSYLVMEYESGKRVNKDEVNLIIDFLKRLHTLNFYHGDVNTTNFIIKNKELKVIDTQGKKCWFGEYRKYYDMFTLKEDLLIKEYKIDIEKEFAYSKNIWYYLAYFVKYGKKNKYIEKIKKWKKKKRDKGWKI